MKTTSITWNFVVTDEEQQKMEIHLFENNTDVNTVIVLDDQEDRINELCEDIQFFVNQHPNLRYEIKNDGDLLGIIVDVWADDSQELINTACFWFEDYITYFGI